jgi:bacterioferritin
MNFEDVVVRSNKPYPEIVGAQSDSRTVCVLKNLATSRVGELGAILQYTYQGVVADKIMQDVAKILEEISIVEMMHLEMLMHAITEFGGIPKYEDCQGLSFNAKYVNYSMKLHEMLNNNILGEKTAINNYQQAINLVENESLKKLFARIIEDEEMHIKVFEKIKNNVEFLSI